MYLKMVRDIVVNGNIGFDVIVIIEDVYVELHISSVCQK